MSKETYYLSKETYYYLSNETYHSHVKRDIPHKKGPEVRPLRAGLGAREKRPTINKKRPIIH